MNNKTHRVLYLDILRVLSALAVVATHLSAAEYYDVFGQPIWWFPATLDTVAHCAVPIFVMISGALFLNPDRRVTWRSLSRQKIPHLFLLYIFWWVAYFFLYVALDLRPFTRAAFLKPTVHLWFLPMLIGLYLIVPFLRQLVKNKRHICYFLILWIAFTTFSNVPIIARFTDPFLMNFVMGYAGYFVMGYFLAAYSFTRRQNRMIYYLGLWGVAVAIAGTLISNRSADVPVTGWMHSLTPMYILFSAAVFLYVKNHSRHCGQRVRQIVDYVKDYTLGIYLVHIFWIRFLATEPVRHFCSIYITLPVLIIAIFLISFLTVAILKRIPVVKKIVT